MGSVIPQHWLERAAAVRQRESMPRQTVIPTVPTDPKTLVRQGAPETSVQAALALDVTAMEQKVLDAIRTYGERGCISDELRRDHFAGYSYSSVTARYAALIDKGLIEILPKPRRGDSGRAQRVMRADGWYLRQAKAAGVWPKGDE